MIGFFLCRKRPNLLIPPLRAVSSKFMIKITLSRSTKAATILASILFVLYKFILVSLKVIYKLSDVRITGFQVVQYSEFQDLSSDESFFFFFET